MEGRKQLAETGSKSGVNMGQVLRGLVAPTRLSMLPGGLEGEAQRGSRLHGPPAKAKWPEARRRQKPRESRDSQQAARD